MQLSSNSTDFADWYQGVFPSLFRNGLWLRGGELNTLAPEEYDRRPFRVLFTRLSTYQDTANSFTHRLLYQLAASMPGIFPDLAYLPPRADLPIFERDFVPWLLGTQTKKGAHAFDLIGFSNSIVQELLNLPAFLRRSGIPLSKQERLGRPDVPLVILGGANALYSSAVTLGDPLVDGIFVGENPQAIRTLLDTCASGKKRGLSKVQVLAELESLAGFCQPDGIANAKPIQKSISANLNQAETLLAGPVPYDEEAIGAAPLQISEGCPCFCSFCAEAWDRKPWRERSVEVVIENALRAKAAMGLDSADIYSFNFNMHSGIYPMLWHLLPYFRNIGLMSQRFDLLAHDRVMVEFQHAAGKAGFTCGLEGISARIRRYLHKNLSDADLHAGIAAILKTKAREIKIFLIATGLEEAEDFSAFHDFTEDLKEAMLKAHVSPRVIFSMTPLVRFPATPLEFADAPEPARYAMIIERAAKIARASGFEFRQAADLREYWVSQILVRADRAQTSTALFRALARTGFVYYREISQGFQEAFDQELRAIGLLPESLLRGFSFSESATKPWTRVQTGIRREFLWEEFQRSGKFEESDYCLGRSWVKAKCLHCGGCPTRFHARDVLLAKQLKPFSLDQFKSRVKAVREAEVMVEFDVVAERAGRGVPRRLLGTALARALMLAEPRLARAYRGYVSADWADEDRPVWVTGKERIRLLFLREGRSILESCFTDRQWFDAVHRELKGWAEIRSLRSTDSPAPKGPGTIVLRGPYPFCPDQFLKARLIKYTLRKLSQGGYCFEVPAQVVKKGLISHVTVSASRLECRLEVGPKFMAADAHSFAEMAVELTPGLSRGNWWTKSELVVS